MNDENETDANDTEADLPKPNGEFGSIMVLDDGGTFSSLHGCRIVTVPSNWSTEDIERMLREDSDDLVEVTSFD